MKNFDRTKYPLDYNFKDISDSVSDYYDNALKFSNICYYVTCVNCGIGIRHEEYSNNTIGYWNIFLSWLGNKQLFCFEAGDEFEVENEFDYSKVFSCAEVMIKNLLE